MANNCLVTKLKATVNNNSLKKLGVFTLAATPNSQLVLVKYAGTSSSELDNITIVGNGTKTYVAGGFCVLESTSGTCYFECADKYSITEINTKKDAIIDFDEIDNMPDLLKVDCHHTYTKNYFKGNVEHLHSCPSITEIFILTDATKDESTGILDISSFPALKTLHISGTVELSVKIDSPFVPTLEEISLQRTVNILPLSYFANATSLKNVYFRDSFRVSGSLADFGVHKDLSIFNVRYAIKVLSPIEDMLEGMLSAGRNSGTLEIRSLNDNLTFNSTSISNSAVVATFSANSIVVVKDEVQVGSYDGSSWTYA